MTELNIVPECYVDTKVAEIVGQAKRKYNHQHGCGDVANQLKNRLRNNISLGIIDEDRNKGHAAKYFSEFETVVTESNLILKRHREREQYLILICPEIEKWLLADANQVGIKPEEYSLPSELKNFKRLTKIQDIDRNEGFKNFIKTLIKSKSPSITTLKKWLSLFQAGKMERLANT